jgi:hypothetical protein
MRVILPSCFLVISCRPSLELVLSIYVLCMEGLCQQFTLNVRRAAALVSIPALWSGEARLLFASLVRGQDDRKFAINNTQVESLREELPLFDLARG